MSTTPARDAGKAVPTEASPVTPTLPWRYDADSGEILGADDWPLVAMVLTAGVPEHTRATLGRFIVRACNAHEQLVAALEACAASLAHARDRLGMCGEGDGKDRKADAPDDIGSLPALLAARTALLSARGGEV